MELTEGIKDYVEMQKRLAALEEKFEFILNLGEHHKQAVEDPIVNTPKQHEVLLKPKAYLGMTIHALRFANDELPKHKWVEVIGMLTGVLEYADTPLERIVVHDYWPVGTGDAVSVNIMSAEPVMQVYKQKPRDHFIVGWCHSHPKYGRFLSQDDVGTQNRYQALWEQSIAIVVDPTMITENDPGFSVFRADGPYYKELRCKLDGMTTQASYQTLGVLLKDKNIKASIYR